MNPELKNTYENMLDLGLGALAHANWHANYYSLENHMWSQLSVLQAAHAAEILIKARIAQEHPLLIFEQLPRSTQVQSSTLDFEHLVEKAKTIQYSDLPERLWAATGIKLENPNIFRSFGNLRNCIQHFADPRGRDCAEETVQFIYKVIDPFIHQCWGLYAVDYNEDTEKHVYLIENLIRHGVEFLVSREAALNMKYVRFEWTDNQAYKYKMLKRFAEAGFDSSGL
ncbi:hypothetical protein K6Q96_14800 [Grimontia kaedaensis]|uniref:HEPN AbiU2-like domain-containing protein n=1 Tax=Grimontia kaedaensis TaxID=2872157 RepID=A0ABY4WRA8_9GAMM|nr:hypothetical protein [Grimontia kaedaensis]USH02117.1 hypothetical protein K6Q96_14800 [Grimontia kaedaensis]